MKIIFLMAILINALTSSAQSQKEIQETWEGFSSPDIFSSGFAQDFNRLPLEGSIEINPRAWSGDYWPSNRGGINIRWNSPAQVGFDYPSPTKTEAARMELFELAALSPTEKYDLFTGNYDYPLKLEAATTASKLASDWAGICNGWAPASLFHNEPTAKLMTNPDGIKIPFGSSDIKALISYFYAFHHDTGTNQMGLRCFFGSWMGGVRNCSDDLNAGAFHIVITNKLGLQREGFLVDVDRFREIWNQPAVGFKSKVLASNLPRSEKAASKAVREVRISTEFFYVDESIVNTWEVVHGTKNQSVAKRDLQYRIELDAEDKIVGGTWESRDRPDFIWKKRAASSNDFTGIFTQLPRLLND
jgi:hypothetical protein